MYLVATSNLIVKINVYKIIKQGALSPGPWKAMKVAGDGGETQVSGDHLFSGPCPLLSCPAHIKNSKIR